LHSLQVPKIRIPVSSTSFFASFSLLRRGVLKKASLTGHVRGRFSSESIIGLFESAWGSCDSTTRAARQSSVTVASCMYLESHRARDQALTGHACCGCEQSLNSKFPPRIKFDSIGQWGLDYNGPLCSITRPLLEFARQILPLCLRCKQCDLAFATAPKIVGILVTLLERGLLIEELSHTTTVLISTEQIDVHVVKSHRERY